MNGEKVPGVAIVTGAARGIGRSVALRLASDGYSIAVADRSEVGALETVDLIRSRQATAEPFVVDVSDTVEVNDLFSSVTAMLGSPCVLVNVAGILSTSTVVDLEDEEWDRVLAVNLKGTFLCARAAVQQMQKAGAVYGRIVNVSSEVAKTPQPGLAHYAASKAGVIAFTQALALELAGSGVTANCVIPTLTDTPMIAEHAEDLATARGGEAEEWLQTFHELVPMGRMAKPDEVSSVIAFLVSAEAGFVTGACYNVTGGREIH